MGKAIEKVAKNRGHEIVCTVDARESTGSLNEADAAINFSVLKLPYLISVVHLNSEYLWSAVQQVGWTKK